MKEFTKDDLKTGMLVERRDGKVYIVINDMFVNDNGILRPEYYSENLENLSVSPERDIIKVSNIKTASDLMPDFWTSENITNDILWQREEQKKQTLEPMYIIMHDKKYKLSEME